MRRATTPAVTINIDECLTDMDWYRVAFSQRGGPKIIKDEDDCELSADGKTIKVRLTQQETLAFSTKEVLRVQVRFGMGEDVQATDIANVTVAEILDEEVI